MTTKLDLVARNMKNLVDMVKEEVKTAIDDKIAESVQITAPQVLEIMDEKFKAYQVHVNQGLVDTLKEELQKYIPNFEAVNLNRDQSGCGPSSMRVSKSRDVMYGYAGQMWDVPKGFFFPQQKNLKLAWMMWVNGFRGYETINHDGDRERAPVRPFRDMDPKRVQMYST